MLAHLAIYDGLRLEELLPMQWSDIDFANNRIQISKAISYVDHEQFLKGTKTEKSTRTFTIPKHVIDVLKELEQLQKSDKVFNMHYSTPYHWLTKTIKRYNGTRDIKLPLINMLGTRHTNATLQIAQGVDIRTVSDRLGHNNTTTTLNTYSEFIKSRDEAAAEALENLNLINRSE